MDAILLLQFYAYGKHSRSFIHGPLNSNFSDLDENSSQQIVHPLSLSSDGIHTDVRHAKSQRIRPPKRTDSWDQFDESQIKNTLRREPGVSRPVSTSSSPQVVKFFAATGVLFLMNASKKLQNNSNGYIVNDVNYYFI